MKEPSVNVLGTALEPCSAAPLTGFFRNGCCDTGPADAGAHTVCAVMTAEFLALSKYLGNDLSTPRPEFGFAGLRPGNRWCLCANRFLQAHDEGAAPQVNLAATHARTHGATYGGTSPRTHSGIHAWTAPARSGTQGVATTEIDGGSGFARDIGVEEYLDVDSAAVAAAHHFTASDAIGADGERLVRQAGKFEFLFPGWQVGEVESPIRARGGADFYATRVALKPNRYALDGGAYCTREVFIPALWRGSGAVRREVAGSALIRDAVFYTAATWTGSSSSGC